MTSIPVTKVVFVGLGKMGLGMTKRILTTTKAIHVYGYDLSETAIKAFEEAGGSPLKQLKDIRGIQAEQRIVWLMLPTEVTSEVLQTILPMLNRDDIVVNGGNECFIVAEKQAELCKQYGVIYFDIGVSGGQWVESRGACLMIGGPAEHFPAIEPIARAVSIIDGYKLVGEKPGSGFLAKGLHNIAEYGIMQALCEVVPVMEKMGLNPTDVLELWRHGSVCSSFLLDMLVKGLGAHDLDHVKPSVGSVTINNLLAAVKEIETRTGQSTELVAFRTAVDVRRLATDDPQSAQTRRAISVTRNSMGGHPIEFED